MYQLCTENCSYVFAVFYIFTLMGVRVYVYVCACAHTYACVCVCIYRVRVVLDHWGKWLFVSIDRLLMIMVT